MENVEDAKGLKPDEQGFDAMTAKFVDQLADGGRAGYFLGGNIEGGYSQSRTDSGGPQTTTTFNGGGGNDNPPPVTTTTTGNGGITEAVPISKRTQYGFNFKNMFPGGKPFYGPIGGEEEEDKVSKMTTAANTVTNYKDFNDRNQKAADIAAEFAKKEKLYAKGGRAGYAKGGLAKILEL